MYVISRKELCCAINSKDPFVSDIANTWQTVVGGKKTFGENKRIWKSFGSTPLNISYPDSIHSYLNVLVAFEQSFEATMSHYLLAKQLSCYIGPKCAHIIVNLLLKLKVLQLKNIWSAIQINHHARIICYNVGKCWTFFIESKWR